MSNKINKLKSNTQITKPKKTAYWCKGCGSCLVGPWNQCPVCGLKISKNKY